MFLTGCEGLAHWALRAAGLGLAISLAWPAQAEGLKLNSAFEGGLDTWVITPRLPQPLGADADFKNGSAYEDHLNLALPDSETQWHYRSASPWLRFTSAVSLSPNLEARLRVRADQWMGAHVDVALLDWGLSPYVGFRAGVVNFNTNWCRTYDVDTPWMAEPDVFCRRNEFMKLNNAAPGLQAYTNTPVGAYQIQTILGMYRPRWFDYETEEFGFNTSALRSHFKREFNRKISAAVNVLNLQSGTQLRWGAMRSDEAGDYVPKLVPDDRARHNVIDNVYLGWDLEVHPSLRLRYSRSTFVSRDYYDDLLTVQDRDKSETLELIYDQKSSDYWAWGGSRFSQAASVSDAFKNKFVNDYYFLKMTAWMVSWRHQWGKGLYSTLQWTHASQINGYEGGRRPSSGDAIGLRLGYQY